MRSINIYWSIRNRDKRRGIVPPLRERSVQNCFVTAECVAIATVISMIPRAPSGAYALMPDAMRRMNSGELDLKMIWNDVESTIGEGLDA